MLACDTQTTHYHKSRKLEPQKMFAANLFQLLSLLACLALPISAKCLADVHTCTQHSWQVTRAHDDIILIPSTTRMMSDMPHVEACEMAEVLFSESS